MIVQAEKFLIRTLPVIDVRLVPGLPVPLFHLLSAIPVDAVQGPPVGQLLPFLIIVWGISPACIDLIIGQIRIPVMTVRLVYGV